MVKWGNSDVEYLIKRQSTQLGHSSTCFVFYVVCFRLRRMVSKLKLSSSMTDGILKLPVKCCRKRQVLERNCEIQTFKTGSFRRSKLRISKCRNCESDFFQTLVGLLLIFGECLYIWLLFHVLLVLVCCNVFSCGSSGGKLYFKGRTAETINWMSLIWNIIKLRSRLKYHNNYDDIIIMSNEQWQKNFCIPVSPLQHDWCHLANRPCLLREDGETVLQCLPPVLGAPPETMAMTGWKHSSFSVFDDHFRFPSGRNGRKTSWKLENRKIL